MTFRGDFWNRSDIRQGETTAAIMSLSNHSSHSRASCENNFVILSSYKADMRDFTSLTLGHITAQYKHTHTHTSLCFTFSFGASDVPDIPVSLAAARFSKLYHLQQQRGNSEQIQSDFLRPQARL